MMILELIIQQIFDIKFRLGLACFSVVPGWTLATLAIDNHTALLCAMERRLWTLLEVHLTACGLWWLSSYPYVLEMRWLDWYDMYA